MAAASDNFSSVLGEGRGSDRPETDLFILSRRNGQVLVDAAAVRRLPDSELADVLPDPGSDPLTHSIGDGVAETSAMMLTNLFFLAMDVQRCVYMPEDIELRVVPLDGSMPRTQVQVRMRSSDDDAPCVSTGELDADEMLGNPWDGRGLGVGAAEALERVATHATALVPAARALASN